MGEGDSAAENADYEAEASGLALIRRNDGVAVAVEPFRWPVGRFDRVNHNTSVLIGSLPVSFHVCALASARNSLTEFDYIDILS